MDGYQGVAWAVLVPLPKQLYLSLLLLGSGATSARVGVILPMQEPVVQRQCHSSIVQEPGTL